MVNNPYEVLGVPRNASNDEIKKHTDNCARSIIRIRMWIIRWRI